MTSISNIISITFIEPAEAPQNVEVFAVSSTMIVVTWEEVPPTDQNGIITQYEVRINQSTFDEVSLSDFVFTNGSTMMVEWDNLEEFVEYSIRVRALTSVGPGPFSIAESNRTLEDGECVLYQCHTAIVTFSLLSTSI